jgi:hypothetical protein
MPTRGAATLRVRDQRRGQRNGRRRQRERAATLGLVTPLR